jgi:cellulose synthase/poly-beta-1,6-N-acetylglucosamine synthase-like glycosyltransferase
MGLARLILAGSFGLLVWGHGGYLAFLALLRRATPPRHAPIDVADEDLPAVVAVVGVYNAAGSIQEKLADVLALDYPRDKLRIVVASDGSDDGTNEIVERFRSHRVELVAFPERRGRALVNNDVVPQLSDADWLLFTDADTRMQTDFLRKAAGHLIDLNVAMVDGSIVCANPDATAIARGVGVYWRYESALKRFESDLGILASTFGGCTLLRPGVFRALDATEDIDFTTPLDALEQGYRIVHEPRAVAFDYAHEDAQAQFSARRRMVAKNLPGTLRKLPALTNRPGLVGAIVSHKLIRWTTPVYLTTALLSSAVLARSQRSARTALGAQLVFYAAGATGAAAARKRSEVPVCSTVFSFLVANAGFAAGLAAAARRRRITTWEPRRGASGP